MMVILLNEDFKMLREGKQEGGMMMDDLKWQKAFMQTRRNT